MLRVVGVHDEVRNGGLVLKKLEGLIQVLRCKVEIALIPDRVGRNVGKCVMGFVASAEVDVGIPAGERRSCRGSV